MAQKLAYFDIFDTIIGGSIIDEVPSNIIVDALASMSYTFGPEAETSDSATLIRITAPADNKYSTFNIFF